MNKIHALIRLLSLMALSIVSLSYALELQDINLPLTRNDADNQLSKDYSFTVLEDASLRRSWKLKDKTVHIDFDLRAGGKAICVIVEYKSPVSVAEARKDISTLTGADSKKKLRKVNKELAQLGLKGCLGTKTDKGWGFAQPSSKNKKKCGRVLIFTKKPNKDRLALSAAREGGNYTAMGSSGGGIDISAITKAEEARRNAKPATPIAAAPTTAGKDKNKPAKPIAAAETTPAKDQELEGVETEDSADAFGDEDESFAATDTPAAPAAAAQKGFLPEAVSAPVRGLLAGAGLSALVVDIIIVAVAALLLLFIFSRISAARRKKQSRAAYESIVNKQADSAANNNEAK